MLALDADPIQLVLVRAVKEIDFAERRNAATDSMSQVAERIHEIGETGVTAVHLHMVGRDQESFIDEIEASGGLRRQGS